MFVCYACLVGIIYVAHFSEMLVKNAYKIPVEIMDCYLEIGGPKLGRNYSDGQVAGQLRESLICLPENFMLEAPVSEAIASRIPKIQITAEDEVVITPPMMCVDPLNFESAPRCVEALGGGIKKLDLITNDS